MEENTNNDHGITSSSGSRDKTVKIYHHGKLVIVISKIDLQGVFITQTVIPEKMLLSIHLSTHTQEVEYPTEVAHRIMQCLDFHF